MKRLEQIANDFLKALAALEDAARQAKSELEIDGAMTQHTSPPRQWPAPTPSHPGTLHTSCDSIK